MTRTTARIGPNLVTGEACKTCGTAYDRCTVGVLKHRRACCAACSRTDTHDAKPAELTLPPHVTWEIWWTSAPGEPPERSSLMREIATPQEALGLAARLNADEAEVAAHPPARPPRRAYFAVRATTTFEETR